MTKKIALVTGGGSGMGKATCEALAEQGCSVAVLDINEKAATLVAEAIVNKGGQALAIAADVSCASAVDDGLATIRSRLGEVNILVNNAAMEEFCPFEQITTQRWDAIFDVNLKSVFQLTQKVLPAMIEMQWGRVINIGAYGAQMSTPFMGHYYASKGGLFSLTRCLAAEVGGSGITVNTVSPGFIDTPMARRAIAEGNLPVTPEQIVSAYPIPRLGQPEEVAAACAFLASQQASYITAQLLGVDGGAVV